MNEFKIKNGLILESGSLSNTSQQFVLTYNTSSGQVFYITGSSIGGGGSGAGFPYIGDAVITGSLTVSGSGVTITGSLNSPNITGSLLGTASWAQSASNAINSQTASFLPTGTYNITASWAETSSQALTASYVTGYSKIIYSGSLPATTGQIIDTGGGLFKYRLSGSLGTLSSGDYEVYILAIQSGAGSAVDAWITTNPSVATGSSNNFLTDNGKIPGAAGRSIATTPVRVLINVAFRVNSPTQYFLYYQTISSTASPSIFSFSTTINTLTGDSFYILKKSDL
jgi:hypothetical protein